MHGRSVNGFYLIFVYWILFDNTFSELHAGSRRHSRAPCPVTQAALSWINVQRASNYALTGMIAADDLVRADVPLRLVSFFAMEKSAPENKYTSFQMGIPPI